jgi:hypothetical protein
MKYELIEQYMDGLISEDEAMLRLFENRNSPTLKDTLNALCVMYRACEALDAGEKFTGELTDASAEDADRDLAEDALYVSLKCAKALEELAALIEDL